MLEKIKQILLAKNYNTAELRLLNPISLNLNSVKRSFIKNVCFTNSVKRSKTLKPVCAILARTDLHFALRLNSNPTDFAFSIRWVFVLKVVIRYHSHLQLRCAVWYAAVVVYGEVQLLQQDAPASGVVVLGDGIPSAGRMGAPGVVVFGAYRLDAQILPDKLLRRLGMELVEGRFLGRIILIQPLLQREAEAALDDGVGREALFLEVRPQGRAAVVQDILLHGIPDRGLRPAVERQLVAHGM